MASLTFYLSRVLGSKVYIGNEKLGKVSDILMDASTIRPRIIAVAIKDKNGTRYIDYSNFGISKVKGQYKITCKTVSETKVPDDNTFLLKKHILDKQLVDIDGRKLVRVNDLRLAVLSNATYLVAVDVGIEGLLRRLDVAKPMKTMLKAFGQSIPSKMILWDEVETVSSTHKGIKLSKVHSKLSTLHPSDLADIIEELDRNTQAEVFASLDEEKAADVLEELESEALKNVLDSLSIEKAADMLEKMPADEVADILDELQEDKAEELLAEMEGESSEEVRELMEYPENSVGSLMNTDFIGFNENTTVADTLAQLRKLKPEAETVYCLYVINDTGRCMATVSLRDVVVSEPNVKLGSIMNTEVIKIRDYDKIDFLADMISKYNLMAIPVVDDKDKMVGMVIIDDVIDSLLKHKRRKNISI